MSTTYTPDGAAVNTAPPPQYVSAAAVIAASASVTAECTYQYRGQSHITVTATVTPAATYDHRSTLASVHAKAQFGSLAQGTTRTTAGSAKASSKGTVVAFVYRFVSAVSSILATGSVLAIPANAIGYSDIDVSCTVSAEAVRIQLPRANPLSGNAVVTAEAALGCPANPTGTATLYVETGINGVYEAFTDNTTSCTATVDVNPYTFTNFTQIPAGSIDISCLSGSTARATRIQRPRGEVLSVGVALVADAKLTTSPGFPIYASASVTAEAIAGKLGVSNLTGSATVQANARQKFLAASSITATGGVSPNSNTIFFEHSNISVSASVEAHGTIVKLPVADVSVTATIPAVTGNQTFQGQAQPLAISSVVTVDENVRLAEQGAANISGTCSIFILDSQVRLAEKGEADVVASADTYLFDAPYVLVTRYVEANLTQPAATVTSEALRVLQPVANVDTPAATVSSDATYVHNAVVNISTPAAVVTPVATRVVLPLSDISATGATELGRFGLVYILRFGESDIIGTAIVDADSVANAASIDPPERTFIRPPENTTFVRPAQEFTFRKLA